MSIIREYSSSDVPQLVGIWNEAFGDSEELIGEYFRRLDSFGRCYVALVRNEVIGMASVLTCQIAGQSFGYVYAVAVRRDWRGRGIGTELMRYCRDRHERLCTYPATEELCSWYQKTLRMIYQTSCRYEKVPPFNYDGWIRSITHEEYIKRRAQMVEAARAEGREDDVPQTKFPEGWYAYQRSLCRLNGGGMFEFNGSIACAYIEDEIENGIVIKVLKIVETLGNNEDFVSMLCFRLDADYAVVRHPCLRGSHYICSDSPLPGIMRFGLALD